MSACSLRVQAANLETLVHVKESLADRVRDYIKSTNSFPKRIVYLRDGVGETQQAQIVQEEWKALCDAVNEVRPCARLLYPAGYCRRWRGTRCR